MASPFSIAAQLRRDSTLQTAPKISCSAASRMSHSASVPTEIRKCWSIRGALKWRTKISFSLSRSTSSAASWPSWRANSRFAADGTTSKPSAVSPAASRSRLAIDLRATVAKPRIVLVRGDGGDLCEPIERIGIEAVLHAIQRVDQRPDAPNAKPTRMPASERDFDTV